MSGNASSISDAIKSWKQDLGADSVGSALHELESYAQSTCASQRRLTAVLRPRTLEEVQKIVATANQFKTPLYPISTGKQWGMGSRLPVQDGAAVVDLGRMNRIIEVNAKYHYAIVEPGVTQRQLLDHIKVHNLPLMLNVTGSTSDTSLIGNAMDRGVGYFSSRAESIANLTIVLGNGEVLKTGFGHFEGAKTQNLYHHGAGPDLSGLFPQGNYGIVTSACIDLMPMSEEHMAVIIKIDSEDKLPQLIDVLAQLRSRGVFLTIAHVGNRERTYVTLAPLVYEQLVQAGESAGEATRNKAVSILEKDGFGPWSAAVGVLGTHGQLKLAKKEIRKAVGGFARALFLNDALVARAKAVAGMLSFIPAVRKQLMLLKAVEPVYGFTRGEATDKALKSVYWAAGDFDHLDCPDPDHSDSGILFCIPTLPNDGDVVNSAVLDTRAICSERGFDVAITVNLIDAKASEAVVSIGFNRCDEQRTASARACMVELEEYYIKNGLPLLRYSIDSMQRHISESDPFWRTVRDLNKILDPNNIIAPGRYNLI
ncbi:FAD-binding oxidoreductase [Pontiella sulfatireligans]|uniref:4-cresol dehydrogenase [hydroxylating] flavoprotein subunit n=1 Tax=Pontiella sulfatireligans TaxID=2750658 RepID=A0A6C2UQA7_9BACT|nr:FAD-dependent oxidoreductase [Pontiella sulfatireligans]VGO22398.1 4-cresol dehydrogenase [hydroxylating] flavoprotein subunit [Pontiella sulfatireligans]